MTASAEVSPKAEKVPNPKAYGENDLFALPEGQTWDEVTIGGIDFALAVPTTLEGMSDQVKGNVGKATQLYSRALRIDAPAKLKARERLEAAKRTEDVGVYTDAVTAIQVELLSFDVTSIATRAPRQPTTVEAPNKASYTNEEVAAMLAAKGIKFVTK